MPPRPDTLRLSSNRQRAPLSPAARTDAAYFLGVISAGRYREISKPAATWHMVGFVQIFFIPFLLFHRPEWTDPVDIQPLLGTVMQRLVHYVSKWTNEKIGSENSKTT
jgi:hypothetical protein